MNITKSQRALIEQSLDELSLLATRAPQSMLRRYMQAVAIVRERPAGTRKVRADFDAPRPTPQCEIAEIREGL